MSNSIWKTPVSAPNCEVSSIGIVRNKKTEKEYTPTTIGNGYLSVHIRDKNNKRHYIHRLVAEAFIPNPDNKPQVNHIDGNKMNNCVENLEWVSCKENIRHAIATGLNTQDYQNKPVICLTTGKTYKSCRSAARTLNINFSQIRNVCSGKCKQTYGLRFRYLSDLIAQANKAERLQKAVDIANEALKYARQRGLDNTATLFAVGTKADKALDEIRQLIKENQ